MDGVLKSMSQEVVLRGGAGMKVGAKHVAPLFLGSELWWHICVQDHVVELLESFLVLALGVTFGILSQKGSCSSLLIHS